MASYTKRDLVLAALKELGVAQTGLDITATELADSCARLDALMASWDADGIHVGYPITDSVPVDPSTSTGLRASAVRAVIANLAVELAPMFGKEPMGATLKNAKSGLSTLQALATTPPAQRTRVGTPLGAGQRIGGPNGAGGMWSPFVQPAADEITVGDDSVLDFD